MQWMRSAVGLNMELQKTMTQQPVASQGFVLNFIDLLLQLCRPFTGSFEKYKNFLDKVNCTYLVTDTFVQKASTLDKIETSPEKLRVLQDYLEGKSQAAPKLSGITAKTLVKPPVESSLLGEVDSGPSDRLMAPHFITECFFLVHILISFGQKKLEQFYMRNNDELSRSHRDGDYAKFDDCMAHKVAMDAHLFGKPTLPLYQSLFTFTAALLIVVGEEA